MRLSRITAALLAIFMLLTMVCGCKSSEEREESAFNDEYVGGTVDEDATTDKPTVNDPTADAPTVDEPSANEPTADTPTVDTPTVDTPTANEPTTDEPTTNEPTADEPTVDEPATNEPVEDEERVEYDEKNRLKIIAYNIRFTDDDGGNSIDERAPRFKMLIDDIQPDIMALSEATPKWISYLETNIAGAKYKLLYTYRAESSQEAQPLLFDQTKFELLDNGYFWLSETPDIESKGWGSGHYRGCTWAKLKVKATGKSFLYYSTHLTGSDTVSTNSIRLIVDRALLQGGFTKYPVFVSGDFNFEPESAGYNEAVVFFTDVNDYLGFDPTFTNGGYNEDGVGTRIIDYVMCSPDNVLPLHYEVLHRKYLGGFISDHNGLYVEAALI